MRSQRYFFEKENKRPVQMKAYVQCSSLLAAIAMALSAVLFGLLASFKFGRSLLEKVLTLSLFTEIINSDIRNSFLYTVSKIFLLWCFWSRRTYERGDGFDIIRSNISR